LEVALPGKAAGEAERWARSLQNVSFYFGKLEDFLGYSHGDSKIDAGYQPSR
jgi:hypothetical protein